MTSTRGVAAPPSPVARARRRADRRETVVLVALGALLVAGMLLSLGIGTGFSPAELAATFAGAGPGGSEFIVFRLALPRIALAVLVGVAFGISGALLQAIARNPLASPDILGISGGASVGAVGALLVFGLSGPLVALSAFAGAAVTAVAIVLLAWRRGMSGYRFVLVGIALAFLTRAVVDFLLSRALVQEAQSALTWIVGSVAGARVDDLVWLAAVLVALVPVVVLLAPRVALLQLGDDAAAALGTRADAVRVASLAVAVALAAIATSVAGPVAFVAFVAGPIARGLVGGGRLAIAASAVVGAALVVLADLVGQRLLPGDLQVPVGIVTAAVGAPYLLVLLALGGRSRREIR